jgi:hypothetical protein
MQVPITQPGKTPAYTVDDARTFIASQRRADLNTVSGAPCTIDDVRFVTREQAERMARSTPPPGQPGADDLVCVVSLTGPFTGETISAPPGARRREWHPTHIMLVFDAKTGSLNSRWFHD